MTAENLIVKQTQSTPAVNGDATTGTLTMSGDSYPENSYEFFSPVIAWLENLLGLPGFAIRLELHLMYMNTSSVKAMMDIFDLMEDAFADRNADLAVTWYFDPRNERVVEMIEEFREDCSFPFDIVAETS